MKERRLAAIMFTDIVGYTSLMGSNEDRAFEVLRNNRELHQQLIKKFNGSLIKEMGDGMLISFPLASDAVRCAVELQKRCKADKIPLKIGIHQGEMVFEGDDVLGDGVNVASRIQENSPEGKINISGNVYDAVKNKAEIITRFSGNRKFKNITETIKVYEVLSEEEYNPESKGRDKPKTKHVYYALGSIIALLIIALIIWGLLPGRLSSRINKEKSIAVMPFDNESSDEENIYFVNGMMEDVRNNLSKVGDLRVISKTSTEKYRESNQSISEIARELDVNFVLEGTVTKIGNKVKIHAQLIDAETDDHIWVDTYNRALNDVFKVQSEIAQIIARELYTTISPETKQIIETPLTRNMNAYQIYYQARQYQEMYLMEGTMVLGMGIASIQSENKKLLDEAISLYKEAIRLDSTFAQAYSSLGIALAIKYKNDATKEVEDSLLLLADKAEYFNAQSDEAYLLKSIYYRHVQTNLHEAIKSLKKAVQINPSYAMAYLEMGSIYTWDMDDYVEGMKAYHKTFNLDKSYLLPLAQDALFFGYTHTGFYTQAEYLITEDLKLMKDSIDYYMAKSWIDWCRNDPESSIVWAQKVLDRDSMNRWAISYLAFRYSFIEDFKNSVKYFERYLGLTKESQRKRRSDAHRVAYNYLIMGDSVKAMEFFKLEIELCQKSIETRDHSILRGFTYYDLLTVYAFLEEYDKAFENLDLLKEAEFYPSWLMTYFDHDPLLANVRNDPRFKDFLTNAKIKFQNEHNKVRSWLEQENMM